jgi:hypothetical protein
MTCVRRSARCRLRQWVTEALTIPARFNGPPGSGHGAYSAGLLAGRLGAEEVELSLRAPLPLERAHSA